MGSLSKAEQKELDMKEATKRGIPYKQVKAERKKRQELDSSTNSDSDHGREVKRLRTYSKDLPTVTATTTISSGKTTTTTTQAPEARRRTRSFDKCEERLLVAEVEKELSADEWRASHNITVRGHGTSAGKDIPEPYRQFNDAPFNSNILQSLVRVGFQSPTPIQSQAWPIVIGSSDLIAIAKTGSGKTCGFLLPIFHLHMEQRKQPPPPQQHPSSGGPRSMSSHKPGSPMLLVLAPTRELSVQIHEEASKFGRSLGLRTVCCYGGASKFPQISALERGVECIIATPGRLNDLLEMRKVNLSGIKYLVLDEVRQW
jgi:ATP-dependent RNA helicase DDX5/DBP2